MDDLDLKLDRLRRTVRRRLNVLAPFNAGPTLSQEDRARAAAFLERVSQSSIERAPQWRSVAEQLLARLRRGTRE
jgi:hypothetical protein